MYNDGFVSKMKTLAIVVAIGGIVLALFFGIKLFGTASDAKEMLDKNKESAKQYGDLFGESDSYKELQSESESTVRNLYLVAFATPIIIIVATLASAFTLYAIATIVSQMSSLSRSNDELSRVLKTTPISRPAPAPANAIGSQMFGMGQPMNVQQSSGSQPNNLQQPIGSIQRPATPIGINPIDGQHKDS